MIDRHIPVYPIRTAARLAGVKPGRIRVWEHRGLLKTFRTEGGHRLFSEGDIERIRQIKALRDQDCGPLAGLPR